MRNVSQTRVVNNDPVRIAGAASDGGGSYWLLELDGYGTILHSSSHPADGSDAAFGAGANLFEDVDGFDDAEAIRQRFKSFLKSGKAMDSFAARLGRSGSATPAKVTLVKTFETGPHHSAPLVMMEIRNTFHELRG